MIATSIILFIVIIGLSLYDERVQPGLLAIATGLALSVGLGGWSYADTITLFPNSLFLTLTGLLLLFGAAVANGTIAKVVETMLSRLPRKPVLVPFVLAGFVVLLTSVGVGNIGATAMLAPTAIAFSRQIGLHPFLMIVLLVGAANAGALSPLAVTGVMTRELITSEQALFEGLNPSAFGTRLFVVSYIVQTLVSIGGFFLLGGYKWMRNTSPLVLTNSPSAWTRDQKVTLACLSLFVATTLIFASLLVDEASIIHAVGSNVAITSYLALSLLLITRAADSTKTFAVVPWSTAMMIAGIVMYIEIASRAGAIDEVAKTIVAQSPAEFLLPVLYAFSALLSVFSSSSGVVLPLFISLAPGLQTGGISASDIITGVGISAHLVDTSPLSSLGALCIAAALTHEEVRGLYRSLLLWALVMVPTGALISWFIAIV